jgi:predicted NBD/HSP70 family sugar kinase
MIHIEYGKGIGAGIIIEGKLFRGHCSGAGEFGHPHTRRQIELGIEDLHF